MRLTEYRTMLYLPKALHAQIALAARRQKKSLAALIRSAIEHYIQHPAPDHYKSAIEAGLGLWKHHKESGLKYENRRRAEWNDRG